tara:strand:- start:96 stop:791 length:696 start_codon:yes stop_codon:yes gene_type:complete
MSTETNATRAYQHLRDKLISGAFDPGTRLLYGPIGKEIGVSATPVREAAGQLANEGLVDLVPQLGAIVRRMGRKELIEIYEVRLAIEPYAARLAAARATEKQIACIQAKMERLDELADRQEASETEFAGKRIVTQFNKADYAFHLAVIEATGNQALMRTAGQSHVLTRVFGIRRHRQTAATMKTTCDEHRAILSALMEKNAAAAAKAETYHITRGLQLSLDAIDADEDGEG